MTIISQPLHKAAIKDALRPDLERIHFYQGRILVTNAHIGISLDAANYFDPNEVDQLNGRSVSAADFKKYIWRNEVGFDPETKSFTSGRMRLATEAIESNSIKNLYQYIHYPEGESEALSEIGVDLSLITLAASAMKWSGPIKLTFYAKNKAIHFSSLSSEDKAIVMPQVRQQFSEDRPPKVLDDLAKTREALHYCRSVIHAIKPHDPMQQQAIRLATAALGYPTSAR
jgi:hypothetical protein